MANERNIASLVILTDSVKTLQEHVNTGNVFKTSDSEQVSICPSTNENPKLLPGNNFSYNSNSDELVKLSSDACISGNSKSDDLAKLHSSDCSIGYSKSDGLVKLSSDCFAGNFESNDLAKLHSSVCSISNSNSDGLVKLSSDGCAGKLESDDLAELHSSDRSIGNSKSDGLVKTPIKKSSFGNSESDELNIEITKNEQHFASNVTNSELKLGKISGESDSSEDIFGEYVPLDFKQAIDCNEDSFYNLISLPQNSSPKPQVKVSDKQHDCINLLNNAESPTGLSHLSERKRNVTKDSSSNSTNSDSETKLRSPIEKPKRGRKKKPRKKSSGKENSKFLGETSRETETPGKDLVNEFKTNRKNPTRKKFRPRKGCGKAVEFKCVECGKLMKKIISFSKYTFRSSNYAKSRRCQNCQSKINSMK